MLAQQVPLPYLGTTRVRQVNRPGLHARIAAFLPRPRGAPFSFFARPMDIEQVNAIGTLLADLSARTEQLRGYL